MASASSWAFLSAAASVSWPSYCWIWRSPWIQWIASFLVFCVDEFAYA